MNRLTKGLNTWKYFYGPTPKSDWPHYFSFIFLLRKAVFGCQKEKSTNVVSPRKQDHAEAKHTTRPQDKWLINDELSWSISENAPTWITRIFRDFMWRQKRREQVRDTIGYASSSLQLRQRCVNITICFLYRWIN